MNIKELDEATALSIIYANTKRKKRSIDLIAFAKTFKYLVDLYGSKSALSKKVGLSTEMVREFLIPLKLSKEVQKLISERKIDSVDVIREISALRDPTKQIAAANAFTNSLSKDVRDTKRLIKEANLPVKDAAQVILDAKPKGLHILLIDFDDPTYNLLTKQAKKKKINPAELVREIVIAWLSQRENS